MFQIFSGNPRLLYQLFDINAAVGRDCTANRAEND
jgi:hypothetical protein